MCISLLTCHGYTLVHICLDTWICIEITFDKGLCFASAASETLGKAEGADAVDNAEIGGFCATALVGCHILDGFVVYLGRGCCMDIVSLEKGFHQVVVLGQMCHDAQFDLAVVGAEEEFSCIWDECLAYLLSQCIAHGDVLQVGIAAGETACGGDCLIERGVYVSGFGVDQLGECVYICSQQFLKTAEFQYLAYNRVLASERFKDFLVGCVLSCLGLLCLGVKLEYVEKYFSYLTWRGYVEWLSGELYDFLFELVKLSGKGAAGVCKSLEVNAYACFFHACKNGHEWHFHFLEQWHQAFVFKFSGKFCLQLLEGVAMVYLLEVFKAVSHFGMQDVVCNFYVEHISLVFSDVVPVCLEVVTYDHVVLDDVVGQYRTLVCLFGRCFLCCVEHGEEVALYAAVGIGLWLGCVFFLFLPCNVLALCLV